MIWEIIRCVWSVQLQCLLECPVKCRLYMCCNSSAQQGSCGGSTGRRLLVWVMEKKKKA